MRIHRPIVVLVVAFSISTTVTLVVNSSQAEQSHVLCTNRDEQPDPGSPVHTERGGGKLRHRLRNGTHVHVLKSQGNWTYIRYADPGPPVRSEPLRFNGWIAKRYLKACPRSDASALFSALSKGQLKRRPPAVVTNYTGPPECFMKRCTSAELAGAALKQLQAERLKIRADRLKLCWWNTKRLGTVTRDWSASARALKGCDVVGLGEVMTVFAAAKLAKEMGSSWQASTSKVPVGTEGRQEHYAVIYDSTRVSIDGGASQSNYPDTGDKLAREPWSASLKARSFDFTLVLLRVEWGDSASERIAELQEVDDIYRWYQARDPQEQDVIIMGDFNRMPTQKGWEPVRQLGLKLLVKGKGSTINPRGIAASLYDNIIIDPRHTTEWNGKAGVNDVGMKLSRYWRTVSDHLPVWAAFKIETGDDD